MSSPQIRPARRPPVPAARGSALLACRGRASRLNLEWEFVLGDVRRDGLRSVDRRGCHAHTDCGNLLTPVINLGRENRDRLSCPSAGLYAVELGDGPGIGLVEHQTLLDLSKGHYRLGGGTG